MDGYRWVNPSWSHPSFNKKCQCLWGQKDFNEETQWIFFSCTFIPYDWKHIKHSLTPTQFPQSFQINKTSCSIRNFMNKSRCIDVLSHGPAWCVLWGCVCYGMCIFSTFLGYYTLPHHRKSSGVSQEQTLIHQKWVCVIM